MQIAIEHFEPKPFNWWIPIAILGWLLFFIMLGLYFCPDLEAQETNLDIIAQIESSGNPLAVSYRGAKYGRGLYQISEIALLDFNRENKVKIAPQSLFDPKIGYVVAKWYLMARIPQFLRNKGIPVTTVNVLWAYSAGIGNVIKGIKPDETKNYIRKYHKLAKIR